MGHPRIVDLRDGTVLAEIAELQILRLPFALLRVAQDDKCLFNEFMTQDMKTA